MTQRKPLTASELEEHFAHQIHFLETSAAAYDEGYSIEAKRLALTLRVLLHDTGKSPSLLVQIGREGIPFWDSAMPDPPGKQSGHSKLVWPSFTGPPRYVATLDDGPFMRQISFSEWWEAPIFVSNDGVEISRGKLIRAIADQDGGAHVDPALNEEYARLRRGDELGWLVGDIQNPTNGIPLAGAHHAAIRQITHEVLKSLKPGYAKMPTHGGAMISSVYLPTGAEAGHAPLTTPNTDVNRHKVLEGVRAVGRNNACPCGSGKKYKKCHGR